MERVKERDLHMLRHPSLWPLWPWLPIKRVRSHNLEVAIVYDHHQDGLLLAHTNVNDLDREAINNAATVTPEQLLNDGWVVD